MGLRASGGGIAHALNSAPLGFALAFVSFLNQCLESKTAMMLFHKVGENDLIFQIEIKAKRRLKSSKTQINVHQSPEWNCGSLCSTFLGFPQILPQLSTEPEQN